MNKRLLRTIERKILAEPTMFDMGDWIGSPGEESLRPSCGTTCCIGGHAAVEEGWQIIVKDIPGWGLRTYYVNPEGGESTSSSYLVAAARKALDISRDAEDKLFYVDGWPEKFADVENDSDSTPEQKAVNAVARIEHFIATGE